MNKVWIGLIAFFSIVLIGSGTYYALNGFLQDSRASIPEEERLPETETEAQFVDVTENEGDEEESEEQEGIPSEFSFRENIHKMTHQKIYATKKWGHLQITDERLDKMLQTLDEADYTNEAFFREVLTAWQEGDFSNAVDVHNQIWKEKDGTVGEALRLMTADEEQEYVEEHFE
ncbi:hypothetical protein EQV77_11880 [Halobacillus fulvus]|nr:hypothetical protein EQV77_11880 [Halobacillus fulvus]